jgi:endonuclease III
MTSASRTALFGKIHKVLKKYYKPVAPPAERTVLEHLLFACVLEDARYEAAEEAFAALKHTFYDWNEVRVTSISELSEVMAALPDPRAAANRIKRVLHAIFEELYCFDLEEKRKKNLGPTVKWLEKVDGSSKFVVSYVIQAALDGHSIPVDTGTLAAFRVLDLVSDKDVAVGEVPSLERAVGKIKGVEFGSLAHQLGADYLANPFAAQVREILLAIDPEAAKRFPHRRQPKPEPVPAAPAAVAPAAQPAPPASAAARKKKPDLPAGSKLAENARPVESKAADGKKTDGKIAEGKAPETKTAESKKAPAVGKKAPAHSHEAPPPIKPHDKAHEKPQKPEKSERAERPEKVEKLPKATRPEKLEKQEKRPAESPKSPPATDGLGKRKPR